MSLTAQPKILFIFFLLAACMAHAQSPYQFTLSANGEICLKGTASLTISGTDPADTLNIQWSNGSSNTYYVSDLPSGNYSVLVHIKHHQDTLVLVKDTTLYFSIQKELCTVYIDKYFSPNDDNYHDVMNVVNSEYHPNFELTIFNRWGQQVHSQKHAYTPWDGKWNGIALPDGAYYYVFFYDMSDKSNLIKGDVTILR